MNCRAYALAVLAGAAALACDIALSQPRSEPEINFKSVLPVTEPAQVAEWLQRLVGRYKYDGMIQMDTCVVMVDEGPPPPPSDKCQAISGKSDCVSVGTGSGVQCILNVTWQDIFTVDFESGVVNEVMVSYLDPAMELYGLNPPGLSLKQQVVNNKGIAEAGQGSIKGNTAMFIAPCANSESVDCKRIIRIEARPDASLLHVSFARQVQSELEIQYAVMTLRRVNVEEESAPTLKPASQRRR